MYLEKEISQVIIYTKCTKNNEISLEILQIKKHTCLFCMWHKKRRYHQTICDCNLQKKAPSNEESTTTAVVVQKSTTAPQTNLRSSNNFDIACDITCDTIRSSITTTDSTNKRKLTHVILQVISTVISQVILHVI